MAYIDFDGSGEHEILATAYTTVIYEQEFHRDIIKDVFGRVDLRQAAANYDEDGVALAIDFTLDDWNAELRALWALLRTAYLVAQRNGEDRPRVPGFSEWVMSVGPVDFHRISNDVVAECQRGFFRASSSEGPRQAESE